MTPANDVTKSQEHGVEGAYWFFPGGDAQESPTIECACGARLSGSSWAEAGARFDAHLKAGEAANERPA